MEEHRFGLLIGYYYAKLTGLNLQNNVFVNVCYNNWSNSDAPTNISSAMLDVSGTTDSMSPPDDSFPGEFDGITKVTSNWGIITPMAIELLLST